jgi:hypothetical protein
MKKTQQFTLLGKIVLKIDWGEPISSDSSKKGENESGLIRK